MLLVSARGDVVERLRVPGAERGYHSTVTIARNVPGRDGPLAVFGAYRDGLFGGTQHYAVHDPSTASRTHG